MGIPEPIKPTQSASAYDPPSPSEQIEQDASLAVLAAGGALRAVEVGATVLLGLLVCPPLLILVVVVVVVAATTLLVALIASILSTPYLLVRHFRGHHGGHGSLLVRRLRRLGRAVLDLAPHRIVADVGKTEPGR